MSHTKSLFLLAGAALSLGASAALADQPTTTSADTSSVNKDEVRAIVAEMLSDAETRSSLLQGGGTAGHDTNFYMASPDGKFRLNVSGFTQLRHMTSIRSNQTPVNILGTGFIVGGNDVQSNFEIARTRLEFFGHIVNPDLKYFVSVNFDQNGNASLWEAYTDYTIGNGWYLKGGQYKAPFLKEEMVLDTNQLAVDRSITNYFFTMGRVQGVEFGYRDDTFGWMVDVTDGANSANTGYAVPVTFVGVPPVVGTGPRDGAYGTLGPADAAITSRFEWAFMGKRSDAKEFTCKQDAEWSGLLGVAINYQESQNTSQAPDIDLDRFQYTLDGSIKGSGFNFYAAFIGSNDNVRNSSLANGPFPGGATGNTTLDNYGCVVQGGWRFLQNTEAFVRYDAIFLDTTITNFVNGALPPGTSPVKSTNQFVTFGLNHYYAGQAAKFTADVVIACERTDGFEFVTGAIGNNAAQQLGILPSSKSASCALRAQWQLVF